LIGTAGAHADTIKTRIKKSVGLKESRKLRFMFYLLSSMPSKWYAQLKGRKVKNQLVGDFMPGLTNMQGSNHDAGINGWLQRKYEIPKPAGFGTLFVTPVISTVLRDTLPKLARFALHQPTLTSRYPP
jgi:hypothetical protein